VLAGIAESTDAELVRDRFLSVALQVAAYGARSGQGKLARRLRDTIEMDDVEKTRRHLEHR